MPPTHLWLIRQLAVNASSYPSTCADECVQQLAHCPLSLPRKESVAVTLKTKLKRTIFREFPGYWWPFWTQHLSRYGARLFEEERRRWNFDRFRLVVLEQVLDTITVTVYGAAYISSSKYLWTLAFAARQNYRRVNANTLIGAAILFPRAHKMTSGLFMTSAAGKACCKLLQDTSWDLATPEKTELGSDTLEQSLLPRLHAVKHETTQLLQCLD